MRLTGPKQYDAFISYSHKTRRQTVLKLQSALEKLAKPWWQRRAIRVFLDENDLGANPDLWRYIEERLARSKHLILMCSPEAARSKWVRQEVEFWLSHKSIETLHLAVLEGELIWDDELGDFDWERTIALPQCLAGQFPGEPLWVDLRARDLELEKMTGRGAAQLSVPIRGLDLANLVSSDSLQHERTMFHAVLTICILCLLTVASGLFAYFAWTQWDEAIRQRDAALEEEAKFLTSLSVRHQRFQRPHLALREVLRALPKRFDPPDRPVVDEAMAQGYNLLHKLRGTKFSSPLPDDEVTAIDIDRLTGTVLMSHKSGQILTLDRDRRPIRSYMMPGGVFGEAVLFARDGKGFYVLDSNQLLSFWRLGDDAPKQIEVLKDWSLVPTFHTSRTRKLIMLKSYDGHLLVLNQETGKTLRAPCEGDANDFAPRVNYDETLIVAVNWKRLCIFDPATGTEVAEVEHAELDEEYRRGDFYDAVFFQKNRLLVLKQDLSSGLVQVNLVYDIASKSIKSGFTSNDSVKVEAHEKTSRIVLYATGHDRIAKATYSEEFGILSANKLKTFPRSEGHVEHAAFDQFSGKLVTVSDKHIMKTWTEDGTLDRVILLPDNQTATSDILYYPELDLVLFRRGTDAPVLISTAQTNVRYFRGEFNSNAGRLDSRGNLTALLRRDLGQKPRTVVHRLTQKGEQRQIHVDYETLYFDIGILGATGETILFSAAGVIDFIDLATSESKRSVSVADKIGAGRMQKLHGVDSSFTFRNFVTQAHLSADGRRIFVHMRDGLKYLLNHRGRVIQKFDDLNYKNSDSSGIAANGRVGRFSSGEGISYLWYDTGKKELLWQKGRRDLPTKGLTSDGRGLFTFDGRRLTVSTLQNQAYFSIPLAAAQIGPVAVSRTKNRAVVLYSESDPSVNEHDFSAQVFRPVLIALDLAGRLVEKKVLGPGATVPKELHIDQATGRVLLTGERSVEVRSEALETIARFQDGRKYVRWAQFTPDGTSLFVAMGTSLGLEFRLLSFPGGPSALVDRLDEFLAPCTPVVQERPWPTLPLWCKDLSRPRGALSAESEN